MWGRNGMLRYVVAFMLLLGLLAGSMSPAVAEDGASETTQAGEATSAEDDTSSEEQESDAEGTPAGDDETQVESQSELVTMQDAESAEVTFSVTSTNPGALDALPAGTMWSIVGEADNGTTVDFGGSIDQDTALPHSFVASSQVPYGTFIMSFDAGGNVEHISRAIEVYAASVTIDIALTPITVSQVSINLSSTDPDAASTMPSGSSWTVTTTDGTFVDDGVFAEEHLDLPVTIAVESSVPYGEYLVSINALPVFKAYQHSHVINAPIQTVNVPLEPAESAAETSQVTLDVSSSEGVLADTMPEGSTWTISGTSGEGVIASGEFSSDQLELPTSVDIDTPIPYGDHLVTIVATWVFEPYEHVHTIDSPAQTLSIVLDPYVEQPVQTTLSLVPDDGAERDVTIDFEIWDNETEELLVSDIVDLTVPGAFW